ncbi:MAG: hypothetical protein KDD06_24410 [Phaeodactylibacter sp.]|nr:hypothetical protein [Phaeodactylibacter sp.]
MERSGKLLLLLFFYLVLAVWDGCTVIDDCNCPELATPFFDYSALQVEASSDSVSVAQGAFLELLFMPDSVVLVARAEECRRPSLGLMGVAYACSCIPEGGQGDKFGIRELNIYANRPFKADIPAGQNLNSLFKMEARDNQGNNVFLPINELTSIPDFGWLDAQQSVITEAIPDTTGSDAPYRFIIEIVKENGERAEAETGEVFWLP